MTAFRERVSDLHLSGTFFAASTGDETVRLICRLGLDDASLRLTAAPVIADVQV